MIDQLKAISDALGSVLQVLVVLLPAYIVALGLARRAGKQSALAQRGGAGDAEAPPGALLQLDHDQIQPPWKDPAVISGGFSGLVRALFWLSFVLITVLLSLWFSSATASSPSFAEQLALVLYVPNLLIGVNYAVRVWTAGAEMPGFVPYGTVAFALLATAVVLFVGEALVAIVIQLAVFFVLSLITSFGTGVGDAFLQKRRPDPERYPMVEVVLRSGDVLGLVRLYQTTATDYRFLREDGVGLILPSQQIAEIRYYPPAYRAAGDTDAGAEESVSLD